MTRTEILACASQYVSCDRNATHGEPEDNFAETASLWSAYLEGRWKQELPPFTSEMVAAMMVLMKLARTYASPSHADHWIDIAGYAACGGEISTKVTNPNKQ